MSGWQILLIVVIVVAAFIVAMIGDFDPIPAIGSLVVAALLIAMVVFIPMAVRDEARWKAWCVEQGGHVESTSHTTYMPTGKTVVPIVDKDYMCLSDDGRILGVYG